MALGAGRAAFELLFTGDTRGLQRAFDSASRSVGNFAGETAKHQKGLGKYATTLKAGVAGALISVGAFLGDSAHKAVEAEVAQKRLERTLRTAGISWDAHKAQIDRVIQSTANLSGIEDRDLKGAFTNIVRVTGDQPGGLKRALDLVSLSADIARAKHIDVATAGQLLARVAGGNTSILKRYGIQIDKGASSTEALGILQHRFAGQAKTYGETTQGAQDRFRVAVTRLQEEVGTKLIPVLTDLILAAISVVNHVGDVSRAVIDAAKDTVRWVGDMPDHISTAIKASPGLLLDAGKFILKSIWDGFKQTPKIIADAADWLKDQIVGAVKHAFGIHSPSRVFEGIGRDMTAGLLKGMDPGPFARRDGSPWAFGLAGTRPSIPAFADGGDFIVNNPTTLTAGGKGNQAERVTVTPLTRPKMRGSGDLQIIMPNATFTAPGHVTEFGRKLAFTVATS